MQQDESTDLGKDMTLEPAPDPGYDNILEGYECPWCGETFCRNQKVVYAELNQDVYYWFHKRCLPAAKQDLLERMGFDIEERDGITIDF